MEVEKVMLAYLTIQQFRKNVILLPDATVFDEHRIDVPRTSFAPFVEMQKNVLPILDDAINVLSRGS